MKTTAIAKKKEFVFYEQISRKKNKFKVNKQINPDFENFKDCFFGIILTNESFSFTAQNDFKGHRRRLNFSMSNPMEQLLNHLPIFLVG